MPTITLLRHGQASFGAADYDALSDLGRRQAVVAGQALAERGLRAPLLVSGSLTRQRDTAALAAGPLGATDPVVIDDRWDEYDHIGLVGRSQDLPPAAMDPTTFQVHLDRALASWITADESDGWRAFRDGAVAALDSVAAVSREQGRDAVVATSGGVIAAVCGSLLGVPAAGVVALNRVTVNAATTTIISGRSGTSLLTFNDHTHFTGPTAGLRTYR